MSFVELASQFYAIRRGFCKNDIVGRLCKRSVAKNCAMRNNQDAKLRVLLKRSLGGCVKPYRLGIAVILVFFLGTFASAQPAAGSSSASQQNPKLQPILQYISHGWDTLTRSMADCATVHDPKVAQASILYLPAGMEVPESVKALQASCNLQVEHLPAVITGPGQVDTAKFSPHGLLYLPEKYVVPGGRFNEMYGWDSYFILRGLLRDGRTDLARSIVENFFFEIEHYGGFLNANRTYYLTRSQPPFLSSMVLGVYEAEKRARHADEAWLVKGYEFAKRDHAAWLAEPHQAGKTGLARYYDFGDGPPPEGLQDENGHYREVLAWAFAHPGQSDVEVVDAKSADGAGASYNTQVCDVATTMEKPHCEPTAAFKLSRDFYKGDRAMRESGFDISFRFGAYGAHTHHFAPVCLNSLLYKTELDLAHMARLLGKTAEAAKWEGVAATRKRAMLQYLWDAERGMFFDYDFVAKKRSTYAYVTTFYPLFAGLVTTEQARSVVKNLGIFERPGGLATSPQMTGVQWDMPFGWAPLQMLAVDGMRRYGFDKEANRVSVAFLSTVEENFRRDGTIREKYDVLTRSSEAHVASGYNINVIGFGWTNAAFLELLHSLPAEEAAKLGK